MPTLLDLQDEFADALLSAATPVPSSLKGACIRRADRRFAVYRNNVAVEPDRGARRALSRGASVWSAMSSSAPWRMPSCCASRHVSPLLIHYGETLRRPSSRHSMPAAPLPYLADVARLEYARGRRLSRRRCRAAAARRLRRAAGRAHRRDPRHAAPFGRHCRFALSRAVDLGGQSGASGARRAALGAPRLRSSRVPSSRSRRGVFAPVPMRSCSRFRRDRPLPRRCERATAATSDFNASDGLAVLIGAHLAIGLDDSQLIHEIGKTWMAGSSPAMTSHVFSARAQARTPAARGSRSDDRARSRLDRGR